MPFFDLLMPWKKKGMSTLDLFRQIYGGKPTEAGITVNEATALRVSTVFACARVIGNGLAQVPFEMKQVAPDGRTRLTVRDHQLHRLLARKPNFRQTAYEFRELMGWHLVLQGNFYCFRNVVFGKLAELIPFGYGQVKETVHDDGTTVYEVTGKSGAKRNFQSDQIWHVRGPSLDGFTGMQMIEQAREAIALAIAAEAQHARMHKNGVRTTGIYSVEGALNQTQHEQITKWIENEVSGIENTGKALVLDRGAKWTPTSQTGIDAQHLETRRFEIEEICRFFGVMPIMIGYSDKTATYASSEQMFLAHVVHTLAPWYKRIEDSIDANLVTEKEWTAGIYSNFVEQGLLRGDMKAMSEYLSKLCVAGIMTRNEGRAMLELNPLDGLDEPLTPMNMTTDPEPKEAPK